MALQISSTFISSTKYPYEYCGKYYRLFLSNFSIPTLGRPQGERRELKGARAIGSVVLGSARGQNGHPEVLPMALRALSAYQSGMRVPVPPRSAPAGRARRTRALEVAAPVVERAASVLLDLMRLLTVCTHAAHGDGRTSSRTHRCLSSTTCTST